MHISGHGSHCPWATKEVILSCKAGIYIYKNEQIQESIPGLSSRICQHKKNKQTRMIRLYTLLSVFASLLALSAAQDCPAFPNPRPAASSLTAQSTLPDPFQYFTSTQRVANADEWYRCRQPEIKRILQEYQYGFYPDHSQETVTATRSGNTLTVNVSSGGKSGRFTATLAIPGGASASNKAPVMIAIGGVDNNAYTSNGIAVATVDYGNVAPDSNGKTGAFWSLYNGRDIGAFFLCSSPLLGVKIYLF